MQPYIQPLLWVSPGGQLIQALDYWFNGLPYPGFTFGTPAGGSVQYAQPSFIGHGNQAFLGGNTSIQAGVTGGTLATFQTGDLLIAVLSAGGTNSDTNSYTVSAPWQIIANKSFSAGAASGQMVLAYTLAQGYGADVGPTFSTAGSSTSLRTQVHQFRNCKLASPIGSSNTNNGGPSVTAATIGAVVATAPKSIAFIGGNNTTGLTFPPTGWVDAGSATALLVAYKTLVNAGDSTGAVSLSMSAGSFLLITAELLANPIGPI